MKTLQELRATRRWSDNLADDSRDEQDEGLRGYVYSVTDAPNDIATITHVAGDLYESMLHKLLVQGTLEECEIELHRYLVQEEY